MGRLQLRPDEAWIKDKTGDLYECINELQSAETSVSEDLDTWRQC